MRPTAPRRAAHAFVAAVLLPVLASFSPALAAANRPVDLSGTYPIVLGVNPDGSAYEGALELRSFRTVTTPEGRRVGTWTARYRYAKGGEVRGVAVGFGDRLYLAYGAPKQRNWSLTVFPEPTSPMASAAPTPPASDAARVADGDDVRGYWFHANGTWGRTTLGSSAFPPAGVCDYEIHELDRRGNVRGDRAHRETGTVMATAMGENVRLSFSGSVPGPGAPRATEYYGTAIAAADSLAIEPGALVSIDGGPRNSGVCAFRIANDRLVGRWSTRNSGMTGQEILKVPEGVLARLRAAR